MLSERSWESVAKRFRLAVESQPSGAALVTMSVLVIDGKPRVWMQPKVARLEPSHCATDFLSIVLSEQT